MAQSLGRLSPSVSSFLSSQFSIILLFNYGCHGIKKTKSIDAAINQEHNKLVNIFYIANDHINQYQDKV